MSITTSATRAYIKEHYPATPMAALARACGVTRQRVLQLVKEEGLFVRRAKVTWPPCDLAGATMTITEAAELLGIAPRSVVRVAAQNNGRLQRVPGDPTRLLSESVAYYAANRMALHRKIDTPSRGEYTQV